MLLPQIDADTVYSYMKSLIGMANLDRPSLQNLDRVMAQPPESPIISRRLLALHRASLASPASAFRTQEERSPSEPNENSLLPLPLAILNKRWDLDAILDPKVHAYHAEALVSLALRIVAEEGMDRTGYHEQERNTAIARCVQY
jgi:hypothetical protein